MFIQCQHKSDLEILARSHNKEACITVIFHSTSTPLHTYMVNGDPLKYYIVSMNCKTAQSNANIWRCFVLLKCGASKRQWILIELKQINASGHNETRTRRIKEPKSPANQLANAFSLAHSPFQPI